MYYQVPTILSAAVGNNAQDFITRKQLGSSALYIPQWIEGDYNQLCVSDTIAYSYLTHTHKLEESYGLDTMISTTYQNIPLHIVDNHNHVFYAWGAYFLRHQSKTTNNHTVLIHIDQHSDLSIPKHTNTILSTLDDIAIYTNETLTIGDFIKAGEAYGYIHDVCRIKNEYTMINRGSYIPKYNKEHQYIVDIDIDFWSPEMGIANTEKSIETVQKIIRHYNPIMITVASSPCYIDQNNAIDYIKKLFTDG